VHPAWIKISAMRHHLVHGQFEWIWSLDMDAFITNVDLRLEDHVFGAMKNPNASLIIAGDCNVISNSGSFFVRNTAWGLNFLQQVWDMRERTDIINIRDWWENAVVLHLLQNMSPEELAAHVEFAPQSQINAYPESVRSDDPNVHCGYLWQPGDFVVHAAGFGKQRFPDGPEFKYIAEHVHELA
jgi:hypothetical protein